MEPMMDSSHLFHSAQRGLAGSSLSLFLGLKAARKGLPVTDRSVSHTLCGQGWLILNAFNLDLN